LSLEIIEAQTYQDDYNCAYKAADKSKIAKKLIKEPFITKVFILMQSITQEVIAVC